MIFIIKVKNRQNRQKIFSNGGNQVSYPIQISTTAPNGGVNGMNGIAPPSFEPSQVISFFSFVFLY